MNGAREAAREGRRCALERITAAQAAGAAVSPLVSSAAQALGVAPRTVWRWLQQGLPGQFPSKAWEPSEDDVDCYVRWKGNAASAWRERKGASADVPALRTFQDGIARRLGPGDRAVLRDGVEGRRRHQVYLRWEPEARNQLWETDHKQMDIEVLFPRTAKPRQPWTTMFLDGFSRAVMGWAISDYPSSASVLAAFGDAVRVDDSRGPFGGLPATLRPDGGLEFAAEVINDACGVLGVHLLPTPPYSPNLKGKIERLHASMVTGLLAELPHFTGGPRDAAGKLWGNGMPLLGLAELVERFDRWVSWYNTECPHSELGGQTPLQRWRQDASPLRLVADAELRWTLLSEKERKVHTSGVAFDGLNYIAPELNGLVGEVVAVRYRPHDRRTIEIFRGGEHLCTAKPQGALSDDDRAAVLERRRVDAADQARRQRRASRKARLRYSPVTASTPVEDTTVISVREAANERSAADGDRLGRAARADLLDLPSGQRR
ncbi:MAG: Mu transposase C-terminal domain-containing protein [Actinomycetota bacterium]|nr:Mu transposase C-terminal domain-containing protein [Actinomycetota bacterium]